MSRKHSNETIITVDDNDISKYSNASEIARSADSHDTTGYGKKSHVYFGGLKNGTFSVSGHYDTDETTGPRAVLEPLLGTVVEVVRQPEGMGAGLPQDVFDALMTSYSESNPVADMITWSAEFNISDDVDTTAQSS